MKRDVKHLKAEMTSAGFGAAPFAYIVRAIRRMLSPFLGPYHFFLRLEKLLDNEYFVTQNLEKLTVAHVQLRSDVAALANRQGQMAIDLESALPEEAGVQRTIQRVTSKADQGIFLTNIDAGVFLLKSGDLISELVAFQGCWDSHLTPVLEDIARKRQGTAVDVGAHLGLLSAAMAKHFQRVISFEPNDFNYRLLVANMSMNRLLHVECNKTPLFSRSVQLSLGRHEDQEIPLPIKSNKAFDGFAASNLGAYSFTEDGTGIFPATARTLDSYELEDLVFLKIDTQGADGEIIRGAVETIRRCRPVVVFEWEELLSRKYETSLEDVMRLFREANYNVDLLKQTNEKQSDYIATPRGTT
jgi:FkbM family methyltransferase